MVKNNFIEFITSLMKYLNKMGYSISQQDLTDFFIVFEKLNKSVDDIEDILYLSRSLFSKSEEEYKRYEDFFIKFYKREIKYNISDDNKEYFRKNKGRLKEIGQKRKEFEESMKEADSDKKDKISYTPSDSLMNEIKDEETKKLLEDLKKGEMYKKDVSPLKEKLLFVVKDSITKKNFKEIATEIQEVNKILEKIENSKRPLSKKELEANINKLKEESENIQKDINDKIKEIEKQNSANHRKGFQTKNNRVHSEYDGDINLEKSFSKLTDEEKENIKDFIKSEAIKFRTRATRNIRTKNKNRIDFRTTMKKATETAGIPLRIAYEKPKINKAKIVVFLDISGSCSQVSELMIHFLYAIKEVFQGGVKAYAFVNNLVDISEFLEMKDPDTAIEAIFSTIPTRGVYSDYYTPFNIFYKDKLSDITKDTIVYYIGDARNNRNPKGDDNIKEISRKARKAFWFNTEKEKRWGNGDSIIFDYMPYMKDTFEVTNTKELLQAIEGSFS